MGGFEVGTTTRWGASLRLPIEPDGVLLGNVIGWSGIDCANVGIELFDFRFDERLG